MADDEFYREEHPQDPGGGGSGGGSSGGSWGPGSWSWGGGGQGGQGNYPWGTPPWGGDPKPPDPVEHPDEPEWGGDKPQKLNLPLLKVSRDGYLLTRGNELLHGSLTCELKPQILIYLPDGVKVMHLDCALYKITDPERSIHSETDASARLIKVYVSWARPGKFELHVKWQKGHYNHAECGEMQIIIFGLNQGWRVMPLSIWKKVATIEITPDHCVYVNDIKGKINSEEILF